MKVGLCMLVCVCVRACETVLAARYMVTFVVMTYIFNISVHVQDRKKLCILLKVFFFLPTILHCSK